MYEYGPYGSILKREGNAAEDNPFRFSSEYADDELGLVYYNYRYYNAMDGRWINRDPMGEQGGLNLYAFIGNQLFRMDYLGLDWWSRAKQLASGIAQVVGGTAMALACAASANPFTAVPLIGLGLVNVFQGAGDIIEAVWPEEGNTSEKITMQSLSNLALILKQVGICIKVLFLQWLCCLSNVRKNLLILF